MLLLPAMTRYEVPGGVTETSTERRVIFRPEVAGPRVFELHAPAELLVALLHLLAGSVRLFGDRRVLGERGRQARGKRQPEEECLAWDGYAHAHIMHQSPEPPLTADLWWERALRAIRPQAASYISTLRTTRKPVKSLRSPFFRLKRAGRRMSLLPVNQEPPRVMRELQMPRLHALPSAGASR